MTNIYFLEKQPDVKANVDYSNGNLIHTDQDGVLVECDMNTATELAAEWNTARPMLASDGVWVSESGDETLIANGEIVKEISLVADALGYNDKDDDGVSAADQEIDPEEFLRGINRVF